MAQNMSDSERELMKIIWENGGSAFYAEIADRLAENGSTWNKNTVITLLSRLVEKGLLRTSKFGRRNEYKALVSREEYQTGQTENLVDKVFEGNVKGLVANLIRRDMLTPQDYEELYEFWKKGEMQDE